jgi:hypothetical protein
MFDDIIPEEEMSLEIMTCENCDYASFILSNHPKMILCQRVGEHKKLDHWCKNWSKRDEVYKI